MRHLGRMKRRHRFRFVADLEDVVLVFGCFWRGFPTPKKLGGEFSEVFAGFRRCSYLTKTIGQSLPC